MSVKLALCIKTHQAPNDVIGVVIGTHLLPLNPSFYDTPTELVDRATCETDYNFLQLLPYIVIMDERGYVFRYFRGKGGTEDRLHGKISVGVGGHVETVPGPDGLLTHMLADAMRECEEEIGMAPLEINFERLIYNREGVNAFHLAVLGVAHVHSGDYAKLTLEKGVIEDGEFVDPATLLEHPNYSRLEEWSKAAIWHTINILKGNHAGGEAAVAAA